ncbi:MAG: hypothetical protein ACU0FH_18775 [Heliomarina sp.]|uniref:hypothetical protein n=1 Tax=Heliomarina sp. TaxID=2917556 RepID=UPI004058CD4A
MTCFLRGVVGMALVLISLPAMSDPIRWALIDDWDVGFYPATRGCLAFARFDDTDFFIGFDTYEDVPALDITVLDGRWESIEQNSRYPISLVFGDQPPWTLDMLGVYMDGTPGLNILIDASMDRSETFVDEFQREAGMTWSYGDTQLGKFTLRGSRRAFEEVRACQEAHQDEILRMELEEKGIIVTPDALPLPTEAAASVTPAAQTDLSAQRPPSASARAVSRRPEVAATVPPPAAEQPARPDVIKAQPIAAQSVATPIAPVDPKAISEALASD